MEAGSWLATGKLQKRFILPHTEKVTSLWHSVHCLRAPTRHKSSSKQCNFSFLTFFFFETLYPRLDLNLNKYIIFEAIIQEFET